MKIFNPIGITVTLGVHLLVGGVLLFTQGCQSGTTLPDPAEPPPVIPVSELNNQPKRTWDDNRLKDPTRPAWAHTQDPTQLLAAEEWNPPAQEFSNLRELEWNVPPSGSGLVKKEPKLIPYTVVGGDSLIRIARNHGTTVAELKAANSLTGDVIRIGQELMVPVQGTQADGGHSGALDAAVASGTTHKVVAGDSLSRIARQHRVTIAALKAANGLTNDTIRIGQELIIPDGGQTVTPVPTPVSQREAPVSTPIAAGESITHKVAAGEFLSTIARRYGTTVEQIKKDNGIVDERRLQINQELVIRAKPATGGTTTPKAPVPSSTSTLRDSIQPRETVPATSTVPSVQTQPAPVGDSVDTTLSQDENAILEELMSSEEAGVNAIRN